MPKILINDLTNLGLPPKVCWIYLQLNFRKIQFCVNSEASNAFISKKGLPQGFILSPLLFNIYSAKCRNFITRKCEIFQFADDIVIFTRLDNLINSIQELELSVNRLFSYLRSRGLEVSCQKSAFVIFSRKRSINSYLTIKIDGNSISPVPSHKFLKFLDSKLNGHKQLANLCTKCNKPSFLNHWEVFGGVPTQHATC